MNVKSCLSLSLLVLVTFSCSKNRPHQLKALIIDGTNNHYVWPKTTLMMKDYIEQTGLFEVSIHRMDTVWLGIKYNKERQEDLNYYISKFPLDDRQYPIAPDPIKVSNFDLDFSKYDLIISNLGTDSPSWPEKTKQRFVNYMRNGGGLIVVHAANNPWGDWKAFNKMIGLGAWGGRDSFSGPFVSYDKNDKLKIDYSEEICGSHGKEHEYIVTARAPEHPIMNGLPEQWLHTKDELYDRMRGPFENTTILATAFSDTKINAQTWEPELLGTGMNVPVLMAINYEKGRIFHTTLGHFDYSMECIGFITTLQRGAEWAATGKVTQKAPNEFPSITKKKSRPWFAE